jgi:hypothetical protein
VNTAHSAAGIENRQCRRSLRCGGASSGRSGKSIVCGLYETTVGLEVRCHLAESVDALVRSERAADIDIAHDIAAAWTRAAIEKGLKEVNRDQN